MLSNHKNEFFFSPFIHELRSTLTILAIKTDSKVNQNEERNQYKEKPNPPKIK